MNPHDANHVLTLVERTEPPDGFAFYVGRIPGRNVISDGKCFAFCDRPEDGIAELAR